MIATLDLRRTGWLGRWLPAREARLFIGDASIPYEGQAAREKLHALMNGYRCVMEIHGFASTKADVLAAYQTINNTMLSYDLYNPWVASSAYEVILQVLWPGKSKALYHLAELAAEGWLWDGAGDRLHAALVGSNPASLDIIAHSAGNRVFGDANRLGDLPIRNVIMCAAAISCKSICIGGEFERAVAGISGTALVFQSYNDPALKAYRWAKFNDRALGYGEGRAAGPVPPNVRLVDGNAWLDGHSDFRNSPEWYESIVELTRTRP